MTVQAPTAKACSVFDGITAATTTAAAQRFVQMGLKFTLLPFFQKPDYATTAWHDTVSFSMASSNVGVRGASHFAVLVEEDKLNRQSLHERPAYEFLRRFATLEFGTKGWSVFVFKRGRFDTVAELNTPNESIASGALKGCRVLASSGWLGFGLDSYGYARQPVRVECNDKQLREARDLPDLLDALRPTGRYSLSSLI